MSLISNLNNLCGKDQEFRIEDSEEFPEGYRIILEEFTRDETGKVIDNDCLLDVEINFPLSVIEAGCRSLEFDDTIVSLCVMQSVSKELRNVEETKAIPFH